jgi:hypothetical protein
LRSDFALIAIRLRSVSANSGAISRRFRGDCECNCNPAVISHRLRNAPWFNINLDINCVVLVLALALFRGYLGDNLDHTCIAQDLRCDCAAIAMLLRAIAHRLRCDSAVLVLALSHRIAIVFVAISNRLRIAQRFVF